MKTDTNARAENGGGVAVQRPGSATAYDSWFSQTEMKYIRRSPYSIKWKLWGQMPIRAFRIGWMACEAWHRLKRKSQNDQAQRPALGGKK